MQHGNLKDKKRKRSTKKIGLRERDKETYKAWAVCVDKFFSGYKNVKDEMFRSLTKEEELELIETYKNDRPALEERLIQHNIFLAVNLASKYSSYGTDYDDILSSAMYGLNVAARKFDIKRGTKFSTHAVWWIRKYILMATTGNRYNKNIGSKVSIYLDSPEFNSERDGENYNYSTFSESIEPSFSHTFTDAKTPYEKIAEQEILFDNSKLIDKITKSVSASSLTDRDKDVYQKMFIDGMDSSDISEQLGISKHAVAKSRSRIASFISENFSNIRKSV